MINNIDNNDESQSIVIESDNSSQNDILKDDKTETQQEIDKLIEKLQDNEHFVNIKDGEKFKNIKKNKENEFYKLTNLLKNQDNQKYFLSLCEQGTKITFTLFTRILQECSFVKEYIKLNNALVLNHYDDDNNIYNEYDKQNNKVIIFNNNNMENKSLKNIFQKINDIKIINHPRNYYSQCIGQYRKQRPLYYSSKLQVFTYNNPSNWFYPTIDGSKQRATAQSKLLSKIINCAQGNNDKTSLSMQNFCSGNYFGFDLLEKALKSIDNKEKIYLSNIEMKNIIENGLFHVGAEDIARTFIELIKNFSNTEIFKSTTIKFAHKDNFFHKNGCKQFADALTTILNSDKDKYKDVINIIKNNISFEKMEPVKESENEYFKDQFDYFNQKLKEITNDEPGQNIETIYNGRKKEDKVCCGCFGCNNN